MEFTGSENRPTEKFLLLLEGFVQRGEPTPSHKWHVRGLLQAAVLFPLVGLLYD